MPLDDATLTGLRADARAQLPQVVALRRALHATPELGRQLPATQRLVLDALAPLDLEVTTGEGWSSVVAVVRGAHPGPAVLLRGDMDGLPVVEDTGEEFASTNGAMHACGHDLHTSGLVGAARLLAARRDAFAGSVVLMFQPAEEGPGGAERMIAEGVLDAAGPRVVAGYGLHVMSALVPTGVVIAKPGAMLAAADEATITVHGRGGHGSMPHLAADPVPVAAQIVTTLQTVVTREFDIFDPVVVTVGRIAAGTANNVIPGSAVLDLALRSFSPAARERLLGVVGRVADGIAAAAGVTATADVRRVYPVTRNAPAEVDRAQRLVTGMFGEQAFALSPVPITGAEDFSFVLDEVGGAFVGLGATPVGVDPARAAYNHSAQARYDESALAVGPAVLAALALDRLAQG